MKISRTNLTLVLIWLCVVLSQIWGLSYTVAEHGVEARHMPGFWLCIFTMIMIGMVVGALLSSSRRSQLGPL